MIRNIYILLLLSLLTPSWGQSIEIPQVCITENSSTTVLIFIFDVLNLESIQLTIGYDESIVLAEEIIENPVGILDDGYTFITNLTEPGIIQLVIVSSSANMFSGSGMIAQIGFQSIGSIGEVTSLTFLDAQINSGVVLETAIDGSIEIGCGDVNVEATLSFGEVDLASQTIEIHLENSAPVSGFQFLLSSDDSVDFIDAYGGSSEENGFTVELGGNNIVLGFSLSATEIPTGSDVLTIVEFDGFTSNEICLSEGVITSGYEDAQYLDVSYGDCISLYSKGDVNMDIVQIVNAIFADDIISNELIDSWMLTGLTGTYIYTVDLPEAIESGLFWAADTSFGIRIKWNYADAVLGANADNAMFWIPGAKFAVGDISLYTVATYDLPTMQAAQFGLIGVFEDAPSSGSDATYKMRGVYAGIFYNYSLCSSAGSTAPMIDQGLYTWDQTSYNFTIKRDPSIAGSQVLPPFNDGTLVLPSDTTMNILFKDRDSHSTLYTEIMDSWDEGNHPDPANGGNGENSGGDRTYMAFPPLTVDENGAFAGTFDGTNGTPATSGYFYSTAAPLDLSAWGGYATFYYLVISGEAEYLTLTGAISDTDGDGSVMVEAITYMTINNATGSTYSASPIPYSILVSATGIPTNDSDHDVDISGGATTLGAGGKLTFDVISDCAVPVDVTIDYNLTFKRCVTNNCDGDGYHVTPTWD